MWFWFQFLLILRQYQISFPGIAVLSIDGGRWVAGGKVITVYSASMEVDKISHIFFSFAGIKMLLPLLALMLWELLNRWIHSLIDILFVVRRKVSLNEIDIVGEWLRCSARYGHVVEVVCVGFCVVKEEQNFFFITFSSVNLINRLLLLWQSVKSKKVGYMKDFVHNLLEPHAITLAKRFSFSHHWRMIRCHTRPILNIIIISQQHKHFRKLISFSHNARKDIFLSFSWQLFLLISSLTQRFSRLIIFLRQNSYSYLNGK